MISNLRPYQAQAVSDLRDTLRQGMLRPVLQAATGAGKCHGAGTEIIRYDGHIVKVEDIRPGDLLMGPDSLPRTVISTNSGFGELFRVTPRNGEPFICNDVHVLSLQRTNNWQQNGNRIGGRWRGGDIVNIPLDEYLIKSKTFKHLHKLWRVPISFNERGYDLPIDPYMMGVLLGDGSFTQCVGVTTMDEEIVDAVETFAKVHGLSVRKQVQPNNRSSVYYIIGSKGHQNPVTEILRKLCLFGVACGDKFIPHGYKVGSIQERKELLAGLIDTDGHIGQHHCEFMTKSAVLCKDVSFLARSLGLAIAVEEKLVGGTIYNRINISGDISSIPMRIARKRARSRLQKKNVLRTGFNVEHIGSGEYFGFTLEGDGLYLLRDFTVTHNTKIAAAIVDSAMSKGKRIAFVVPSISLIDQTVESFWDEGIRDIGVIQAYHPMTDWSRKVQVCSIQTVACRKDYPEADIVLIDECHRLFTEHVKWMAEEKGKPFIGLSATPWTKGLGKHFETLLVAARTKDLIEQGYLSPFRCFATGHPDLSKVKTLAGDYHEGQLSTAMQAGSLTADIIGTWQALWGQDKTLCFAVDRAHARALQERFQQAGISCGYQDAKTPDDERREIKKMFHNGGYRVVVNIGTLCLDEETEILTSEGWVGIDDMTYSHHIAAWEQDRIEFTNPLHIVRRNRNPWERMVSIAGRNQNVRVTSNHRMVWGTGYGRNQKIEYDILPAESIVDKNGYIPVSGIAPPRSFAALSNIDDQRNHRRHIVLTHKYRKNGMTREDAQDAAVEYREHLENHCQPKSPIALSIDECRFIGFWIGDGTKYGGRYSIAQSKRYVHIISWMDDLISRIGVHCTRSVYPPAIKSTFESVRWNFCTGRGGREQTRVGGLSPYIPYLEKDGTDLFWGLDTEQFTALLEGYWMADGNHGDGISKNEYGYKIHGRSLKLFNLLQGIAACRGIRMSISVVHGKHRKTPFYRITWRKCSDMELVRERFILETDIKEERVWCVTSTTGKLITRRRGKVAVVGNTTGVDWDVRCLILARPTKSEILYTQIIGRALRTAPGKKDALILDHSDTTANLGFVTDIHHDTLDDGKPKPKVDKNDKPLPKPCPKCGMLRPPGPVCANCGFKAEVVNRTFESPGSLVEITPGKVQTPSKTIGQGAAMAEKSAFLSELKNYAIAKGYQPGYAANQFRAKFGVWPDHSIENVQPAAEISPATKSWIRHRQIAWAHSKKREAARG